MQTPQFIRRLFGWTNQSTLGGLVDPGFFPSIYKPDTLRIDQAESYLPINRAINLVSNDVARLPVMVVEETDDGLEDRPDDPVSALLRQPNGLECGFDWFRKMVRDLMLYGNAFSLISSNGLGEVLELISCRPIDITQIDNGDGTFKYRHPIHGEIAPDEILHFRLNGQRPFWGDSPISRAAEALRLAQVQDAAGMSLYQTPGLGKIALESPETLGPDMVAKLGTAFASRHGGKDGHLTPIVTQGGMKVTQVGQSLAESEWITARRYSVNEVSRLFSVPPAFLFDLDKSTLEQSAAQMRSYVSTCLNHWIEYIKAEFYTKLGVRLRFDTSSLLVGTFKEEVESLRMAVDAGILTPNECREKLGFEPLEEGSELMISKNYAEAGVNGTDTETEEPPTEESPQE